jgi:hypothetical protein
MHFYHNLVSQNSPVIFWSCGIARATQTVLFTGETTPWDNTHNWGECIINAHIILLRPDFKPMTEQEVSYYNSSALTILKAEQLVHDMFSAL